MDWKSWWAGFIGGAVAGFFFAGAMVQIFIEPQWVTFAKASAGQAHHASAKGEMIKKSR